MKAVHNALDASIYRLSNVGPHFINCIVDPQNYGPNWSLCRDIESYVMIEFSVFVAGLYRSMQSSVATCSLSSFLDSVAIDFDNVGTKFWCSSLVLFATGMYYVATLNLFATSFSRPSTSGVCCDIIFLVATNIFLFSLSTLSRQDFFESLVISVATNFSFLILVAC